MIALPSCGERVVSDTAFRSDGMVWFGRTYRYTNLWRWLKQSDVSDTNGKGWFIHVASI